MKKIKKLLLPIASVIGMTTCIAPMAACNTTATTVAKTNAATTGSTVTFGQMYETIHTLEFETLDPQCPIQEEVEFDQTFSVTERKIVGWDQPKFENGNKLIFRNSERNNKARIITEVVRVDVAVPATTRVENEISIDTRITGAVTTPSVYKTTGISCCTEFFALENPYDHPTWIINSKSDTNNPYKSSTVRSVERQKTLEAKKRIGGVDGHQFIHRFVSSDFWERERHFNYAWHDKKITYVDDNTTNETKVFSHYLLVTANTFGPSDQQYMPRECGYSFTFSAHEVK